MLSFVIGTVIALLLMYLTCIFLSTSFAMLGFAEALLMVLSFFVIIIQKRNLTVNIDIPLYIVEKNKKFNIHVQTVSSTGIRTRNLKIKVEYYSSLNKKKNHIWINAENVSIGEHEYLYGVEISEAGCYSFCVSSIRIYGFMGLFYLNYRISEKSEVIVLPEIEGITIGVGDRIKNFYGDSDSFSKVQSGYDPSETYDLREYRSGDRLTSVHWKLSAKKDELIIRENSLPMVCAVVILLNMDDNGNGDMFEKAASLSFSLMDMKCPHYAAWFSNSQQAITRVRVDDEESFYRFIIGFMQDCVTEKQNNMLNSYEERYRGERYIYVFEITGDIVTLNGEWINPSEDGIMLV